MPVQSHAQFVCVITLITCVLVVIVTADGIGMHERSLVHAKALRIPHQGNRRCKWNVYLGLQSAACGAGAGAVTCPSRGGRVTTRGRPVGGGRWLQGCPRGSGCASWLGNATRSKRVPFMTGDHPVCPLSDGFPFKSLFRGVFPLSCREQRLWVPCEQGQP